MTHGHEPAGSHEPGREANREPISAEVIALARAAIHEAEIAEDIREVQEGRGLTVEQFIDEVEEAARQAREPATSRS